MEQVGEGVRPLRRLNPPPFSYEIRIMRSHMETLLIVLFVILLLGGVGYGYFRWRRSAQCHFLFEKISF
jgi:hypothetical protein